MDLIRFLSELYKAGILKQERKFAFIHVDFAWQKSGPAVVNLTEEVLKNKVLLGLISVSTTRPNTTTNEYKEYEKEAKEGLKLPPFNYTSIPPDLAVSTTFSGIR